MTAVPRVNLNSLDSLGVAIRVVMASLISAISMLADSGVAVFDTEINELTSIGWSFGTRVKQVEPYGKLLGEIRKVFST